MNIFQFLSKLYEKYDFSIICVTQEGLSKYLKRKKPYFYDNLHQSLSYFLFLLNWLSIHILEIFPLNKTKKEGKNIFLKFAWILFYSFKLSRSGPMVKMFRGKFLEFWIIILITKYPNNFFFFMDSTNYYRFGCNSSHFSTLQKVRCFRQDYQHENKWVSKH